MINQDKMDFLDEFDVVNIQPVEPVSRTSNYSEVTSNRQTLDYVPEVFGTNNEDIELQEIDIQQDTAPIYSDDRLIPAELPHNDAVVKEPINYLDCIKNFLGKVSNKGLAVLNESQLFSHFQKGKLIISGDFRFLLKDNELMLLKYTGTSTVVRVPDSVGNIEVKYLHPEAFKKGKLVKTTALKNVFQNLFNFNNGLHDNTSIKDAFNGIKEVELPKSLCHLPSLVFAHCKALEQVIIPEGVYNVSPNAFKGSNVHEIFFEGLPPKNLRYVWFAKNCLIYARAIYAEQFREVLL